MIEDFIRRAVERAIHEAEHPSGMSIHDGKARIEASYLRRMLAMLDAAPTTPVQQDDEALEEAEVERLQGLMKLALAGWERERDTLERECDARDETIRILDEERDKLRAELAEAKLDAARYRWLRDKSLFDLRSALAVGDLTTLDAAIDAMRKEPDHAR